MKVINDSAPSKEIRIKNKNKTGFTKKLMIWFMFRKNCFWSLKNWNLISMGNLPKKIKNQDQKLIKKRYEISVKITLCKK